MAAEERTDAVTHSSSHDEAAVSLTDRGAAIVQSDAPVNPGFPPHRTRQTDLDEKADKRAERVVSIWFVLSAIGSIFAIVAYFVWPIEPGNLASTRLNNLTLGLGISLGLLGIGIGAVHWAKQLMSDKELVESRHLTRGSEETRAKAVEVFRLGNEESGFSRRSVLRGTLIGALALFPLPAVVLFRDLAPADVDPVDLLSDTLWRANVRLCLDPSGIPIKAEDVTVNEAYHVIPEGLYDESHFLDAKALSVVMLVRLREDELHEMPERAGWSYKGIVAYSKICTHVGCPVALYEDHTHHLLCPCHQSTFDVSRHCEVIFGPAKRPLPQLPIGVDDEGYLIATSGFTEPIGPSFWERLGRVDEDHIPLSKGNTDGGRA
ncbi:cytochrome bc1 complex Rieske iron-sulfur subunit [Humidisolicoccus flavus]|uniref:cytochrome bc1 complex Rieske iron-sulfur subunit n=1 Tax=Humidisolicoccus flavus TaxID=3111414 RepID=UPI003247B6F2